MKTITTTPTSSDNNASFLGEVIKLGIDVHKDKYVVVQKIDSSVPERSRSFKPDQFLIWLEALKARCQSLYSCYEAGAFGYVLHRKLEALGVINHVICPINWDEHHKGVKTDGRDATQMALALDGYLRGNDRSFSVVRVPSEQEEQLRSITRQRQCLIKERSRNTNRGRSHALYYGVSLKGIWWAPKKWEGLTHTLSTHLVKLLQPIRAIILVINEQIQQVAQQLQEMETTALPQGMGTVLFQQTEREVGDWRRFDTRKQVGGYTGLCPSESTSANRRMQGSITKHGNPRLRHMLIECTWLLIRWNGDYRGVQKWREQLLNAKLTRSSKKKIVVAIARQFAVDWWRVRTGRVKPEDIGLSMKLLQS
ncbi:IS110 family transposase [Opitutia bacterium ISCC 51]|nr:IS110 family transposase [Opitutae bacterium ISCC 51]QXD28160.1 IS110 family transposase [Opitutae bacterium ISCC 52]